MARNGCELVPQMAPADTTDAATRFPCARNAALYGAYILISWYGCMSTMEHAIPMYSTEATSSEVTMLRGTSRVGLVASSAALGI
jgi:hypothetical protein